MLIYWLLFLVPVYFLLGKIHGGAKTSQMEWVLFTFVLIILIGFRNKVGCDWYAYIEGLEQSRNIEWDSIFYSQKDAGHVIVGWLSLALDANEYGVNIIYSVVFAWGLVKFSRAQPYAWLAILVATPYLIIVVAMGYIRQATAIGFLMYGFGYLLRRRLLAYLLLVLLAGMIHKTAFVFSAFILFRPGAGKLKSVLGVGLLIGLVGASYLAEQAEIFMSNYVTSSMESGGGQIRTLMNLPPALILFAFWKKWNQKYDDRWLWGAFAVIAVMCVPLVFVASTAVDRMALYLIPLQLVVWARLPILLSGIIERNSTILIVIIYHALVQFTWLIYGTHSYCWVPYDNLLFPTF